MRLCTFSAGGERRLGVLSDDATIVDVRAAAEDRGAAAPAGDLRTLLEGGPGAVEDVRPLLDAAAQRPDAPWCHAVADVTLHHPYRPRKNVIKAGGNSRLACGAAKDAPGVELPPGRWLKGFPVRYHTKAPTSVLDPGRPVTWPSTVTSQVYAEPQLAVVVGETTSYVTPDEALRRVAGYAVATDVSSFDLKLKHGQWPKAVSLDSFFPWGPFVVTRDEVPEPDALAVQLTLNGEVAISGSTADALLPVGEMLAQISFGIRLDPGDVLLLGAPECVGFGADPARWLAAGDVVTSTIEAVGSISNPAAPYDPPTTSQS